MTTLRNALQNALETTNTDAELAEALLRGTAMSEALSVAAVTDDDLQAQLGYTKPTLRAQLSKARRQLSSTFPLPVIEGRWWLASDITDYRADHARSNTGSTAADDAS